MGRSEPTTNGGRSGVGVGVGVGGDGDGVGEVDMQAIIDEGRTQRELELRSASAMEMATEMNVHLERWEKYIQPSNPPTAGSDDEGGADFRILKAKTDPAPVNFTIQNHLLHEDATAVTHPKQVTTPSRGELLSRREFEVHCATQDHLGSIRAEQDGYQRRRQHRYQKPISTQSLLHNKAPTTKPYERRIITPDDNMPKNVPKYFETLVWKSRVDEGPPKEIDVMKHRIAQLEKFVYSDNKEMPKAKTSLRAQPKRPPIRRPASAQVPRLPKYNYVTMSDFIRVRRSGSATARC
eukprot:GFYU01012822.1.p1 GENE.GFYU01012822.1~~GFYU01012822.1.p1  ORF type:complete len:294 (-),score=59.31 GFYU01012822.1:134-1015(-)